VEAGRDYNIYSKKYKLTKNAIGSMKKDLIASKKIPIQVKQLLKCYAFIERLAGKISKCNH
jgi:hypothetical protein